MWTIISTRPKGPIAVRRVSYQPLPACLRTPLRNRLECATVMSELQPDNPSESQPVEQDPKPADVSSRRSFLSKNIKRAAYIAPIVWSVSARTALAVSGVTVISAPE